MKVFENAIIIKNISNYESCKDLKDIGIEYGKSIKQEYAYIENMFGTNGKDWQLKMQKKVCRNDKHYDIIDIELLPSNQKKRLYFDITEPFMLFNLCE